MPIGVDFCRPYGAMEFCLGRLPSTSCWANFSSSLRDYDAALREDVATGRFTFISSTVESMKMRLVFDCGLP